MAVEVRVVVVLKLDVRLCSGEYNQRMVGAQEYEYLKVDDVEQITFVGFPLFSHQRYL